MSKSIGKRTEVLLGNNFKTQTLKLFTNAALEGRHVKIEDVVEVLQAAHEKTLDDAVNSKVLAVPSGFTESELQAWFDGIVAKQDAVRKLKDKPHDRKV